MWLEVIKNIIALCTQYSDRSNKKKEKISQLFMDISMVIDATVKDLQADIYPHGSCQAMKSLSDELVALLKGHVDEEKLKQLDGQLKFASNLELEFAGRKNPQTIEALQKTSGQFHAMSLIYKI